MTSALLPTRVGVLGRGDVGRVLAAGLAHHGGEAVLGTRRTDDADLTAWSSATGIPIVTFAEATAFGDTVILAVRGADHAVGGVLDGAGGPEAFAGHLSGLGITCALTADWPLDEFGRGDIALRVPPEAYGDATVVMDGLDLD